MSDLRVFAGGRACCAREPDTGVLCSLAPGHEARHLGWDNRIAWRGSPGAPVEWGEGAPHAASVSPAEVALLDATTTQLEAGTVARQRLLATPTGELCACGGLLVQRGACKQCADCGEGGSCG